MEEVEVVVAPTTTGTGRDTGDTTDTTGTAADCLGFESGCCSRLFSGTSLPQVGVARSKGWCCCCCCWLYFIKVGDWEVWSGWQIRLTISSISSTLRAGSKECRGGSPWKSKIDDREPPNRVSLSSSWVVYEKEDGGLDLDSLGRRFWNETFHEM